MAKKVSLSMFLMMAALLLLSFGSASAFPLYPGIGTTAGTQFEDDNLDYWLDINQSETIDVGDVLYSAIEFGQVLDLLHGNPAYSLNTAADELVAFATIQLKSIVNTPIGQLWNYGEYTPAGASAIPMVQVYTGLGDSDLDLFTAGSDPSLSDAEDAIKDGAVHLWDFSITDDPDTFWTFQPLIVGANDPSVVLGLGSTTKIGVANYQLNQVWGDDIFNFLLGDFVFDDGLIDLAGSGDILGGSGLVNGAFARSDVDVRVNPIPEPSTLILLGAGLLGLAVMRKKSRK